MLIAVTLTVHTQTPISLLFGYLKNKYSKETLVERSGVSLSLQFKKWSQVEKLHSRIKDRIESDETVTIEITTTVKGVTPGPKELRPYKKD